MRILKGFGLVLLLSLIRLQYVTTNRNESAIVPKTDFMLVNDVPKNINKMLQTSCYDCHSNNTEYPWYNRIQPFAWLIEDHINEGKEELNFSEWDDYSNRRKKSKLKSIISQVKDDEMPLSSYTIIHGDAKLSESDKEEIINWVTQLRDNLP